MNENLISQAVKAAGGVSRVARECGVSHPAVIKWIKQGRLPRTAWTGEKPYASVISRLTNYRFTREMLLDIKIAA